MVLATSTVHPWVINLSLLYGEVKLSLLNWAEAYLTPTWLIREQRLAKVQISQAINHDGVTLQHTSMLALGSSRAP